MCHFISITLPQDVKPEDLFSSVADDVRRSVGVRFVPVHNSHVQAQLRHGEQYGIRHISCDCGTPLGWKRRATEGAKEWNVEQSKKIEQEAERLRKRGWSNTKIARWRAQKESVQSPMKRLAKRTPSPEAWRKFLVQVLDSGATTRIGVLLHWYDDTLNDEKFHLRRIDSVSRAEIDEELLANIEEDVLYEFTAS